MMTRRLVFLALSVLVPCSSAFSTADAELQALPPEVEQALVSRFGIEVSSDEEHAYRLGLNAAGRTLPADGDAIRQMLISDKLVRILAPKSPTYDDLAPLHAVFEQALGRSVSFDRARPALEIEFLWSDPTTRARFVSEVDDAISSAFPAPTPGLDDTTRPAGLPVPGVWRKEDIQLAGEPGECLLSQPNGDCILTVEEFNRRAARSGFARTVTVEQARRKILSRCIDDAYVDYLYTQDAAMISAELERRVADALQESLAFVGPPQSLSPLERYRTTTVVRDAVRRAAVAGAVREGKKGLAAYKESRATWAETLSVADVLRP